ncbi:MAG: DUF3999 domain-containing protein [Bacteroidales bacterium]|jgi:hypothetical protein|nr:DUF3999 domain-containing protein [Bacteroidales bacterium]
MKKKTLISLALWGCLVSLWGQTDEYACRREITGITERWHKIRLPDNIFAHATSDLHDLRIYGVTQEGDTIEAPYLLQPTDDKTIEKEVNCKIINTAHNAQGYYFTVEMSSPIETANRLELRFGQRNFDWQIRLEGSQNQQEWFVLTENYRILSISNSLTDYRFTEIVFADAKYRYLRLCVASDEQPDLQQASVSRYERIAGDFRSYPATIVGNKTDDSRKTSEIEVTLADFLPINFIRLHIDESIDYYRSVNIYALTDSFKTQQGWKPNYRQVTYGEVSSLEKNELRFSDVVAKKWRIIIHNQDNPPVSVNKVEMQGNIPDVLVRFSREAKYFLAYGNPKAKYPQYDIERFADKVPNEPILLALGEEVVVKTSNSNSSVSPLFANKLWLWGVMVAIILLLGWGSLKMLREKK